MKTQFNPLEFAPRLLTLIDRNPHSPTHGCCDRQYWHYKTTDFPNARLQEMALSLALIYKNAPKGSIYKNDKMLKVIESILNFWVKIQHKSGSFSEALSNENSFVAASFSSNAVIETLKILGTKPERVIAALEKSAGWLAEHDDLMVCNHQAGAVPFLYSLYELTGKDIYRRIAKDKLNKLLKIQSKEGWFPEYNGPDAGYLSLTVSFLSSYYEMSKDTDVAEPIKQAMDYLSHFVYPDGTFGGEVFSRNSEIFFSAGQDAKHMDDMYLIWLTSLQKKLNINQKTNFERYFDESGIFVHSGKNLYVICNFKKGGTIKVFKNSRIAYQDCGLVAKHGNYILTNCFYGGYDTEFANRIAKISGCMYKAKPMRLSPITNSAIKIMSAFGMSDLVVRMAKRKLITGAKKTNIRFERTIDFTDIDNIEIKDKILGGDNIEFEKAKRAPFTHTASSNFFRESDF
ncbi:MAG: terpene cyclase/mutase family protein [Nanoarchaeota archaeon]|nr:terpene cyclase/mutase family protein [Nanoarchaeota archaeon]MBU1135397.1 terpene cyclase/mutase family protein [Nanoarchaeota archaeon]MBU2520415.1 terpene cyclase/mutase family protein [Nanoarchaeota archaeon]